jgi:large subunit ribosomal protein L10
MRIEKQYINREYVAQLNQVPFFILVEYRGLAVKHFNELRKRLTKVGAEVHVIKNSIFNLAVKEAGIADLAGGLTGQTAVVTGTQDISATAKVLKAFQAEFEKPKIKFGYSGKQRLETNELLILADLPPLGVLRGKLMGIVSTPATRLVQLLNTPASQLARILQAKAEKGEA